MRYKVSLGVAIWLTLVACAPSPKGEITLSVPVVRYAAASTASAVIDTLPAGITVLIFDMEGKWTYLCYRGIKGWAQLEQSALIGDISRDYIDKPPTEQSLIALAPDDTVTVALTEGGDNYISVRLSQLSPWFAPEDSVYAGFYEGLPGENVGLIIVNVFPEAITLLAKVSIIDPESLEPREEEYLLTSELERRENVLIVREEEVPFRKAEFVRQGDRRGLLIELGEGRYAILWRRRF